MKPSVPPSKQNRYDGSNLARAAKYVEMARSIWQFRQPKTKTIAGQNGRKKQEKILNPKNILDLLEIHKKTKHVEKPVWK